MAVTNEITKSLESDLLKSVSSKNLEEIYNTAKALKGLNIDLSSQKTAVCELASASNLDSVSNIFYIQKIDDFYSCNIANIEESTFSDDLYTKIEKSILDENVDIGNLYKGISILRKAKKLTQKSRNTVVEHLNVIFSKSGKSILACAFASNSLIELGGNKLGAKFTALDSEVNLVEKALSSAREYDNNRLDLGDDNVEVNSYVVRTIVGLARMSEQKVLSNIQITQIANYFLTQKASAHTIQALVALNMEPSPLSKPVKFSRENNLPVLKISMTDVFNRDVDSARFFVKINEGDMVEVGSDGKYDFSGLNLKPGVHSAEISISGAASYAGIEDPKQLKFKFPINRSGTFKVSNTELNYAKKGAVETSKDTAGLKKLKSGDKLTIKFAVVNSENNNEIIEVQQAFIRFIHKESGYNSFAIAKFRSSSGYSVSINLSKEAKSQFNDLSGEWEVEIVAGDNSIKSGLTAKIGSFTVTLGDNSEKSIADIIKENYSPLRLIEHTFKQPDPRPPKFVSLVFTAVVLSPLLLLITLWPIYGLNFKLFSLNLSSITFHTSFTSILLLYVSYWLYLNMFQTIYYLVILSFFTIFSGHRLLSSLAKVRRNEASEKNKKVN
jgi:oligosaccharyltransferase complex subunit delta (ribophorin II)